jgi:hypothetical protein
MTDSDDLMPCGGADVETRLEIPTRQRWQEVLSHCAELEKRGHRRSNERHYVELAAVKLAFEQDGALVMRMGRLLNASDEGLMVKQYRDIPVGVPVQIEVTIADESFALRGEVAHCTQTLGGLKVGIELQFAD